MATTVTPIVQAQQVQNQKLPTGATTPIQSNPVINDTTKGTKLSCPNIFAKTHRRSICPGFA